MTDTLEMPKTPEVHERERSAPGERRWLKIAVVAFGLLSLGLGVALVAGVAADDTPDVPAEVTRVLDDFGTAYATADGDLFTSIVTEDYFFNERFYAADAVVPDFTTAGPRTERIVSSSTFQVERFGDVIVAGDGPWMVAVGEVWTDPFNRWDGVANYVMVDDGGEVKIATYDWVGVKVPVQPDFGN
jgi:hypothetical protein